MDGPIRKAGVAVGGAAGVGLLATHVWVLAVVVGFGLVLVVFAFWVVAYCDKDRQAVGIHMVEMFLRWRDTPPDEDSS